MTEWKRVCVKRNVFTLIAKNRATCVPSANVGSSARFDSTRFSLAFALFAALNILRLPANILPVSSSMGSLVGRNSTALDIKKETVCRLLLIFSPFRIASSSHVRRNFELLTDKVEFSIWQNYLLRISRILGIRIEFMEVYRIKIDRVHRKRKRTRLDKKW